MRPHPGRTFTGTVAVVYPHLMKETRAARVRIELPNPDLALLPDMYGDVEIATAADRDVIAVPSSAVIDSGSRQVVLLDLEKAASSRAKSKRGDAAIILWKSSAALRRATRSSSTATS